MKLVAACPFCSKRVRGPDQALASVRCSRCRRRLSVVRKRNGTFALVADPDETITEMYGDRIVDRNDEEAIESTDRNDTKIQGRHQDG